MLRFLQKKLRVLSFTQPFLVTAVSLLLFSASHAAVYYVNDVSQTGDVFTFASGDDANPGTALLPFGTIQFAITSAVGGDTIYVDAGIYPAGFIDITKSLTLRGAKFGVPAGPAASPINRGTNETIIEGSLLFGQSRDNISVDGFTVNFGTALRGIQARGLNSVIINNIVTGTLTPLVQQAGILTRANAPNRLHSYTIRYNNVRGSRYGIYMDGNLENPSEISYNYVTNCFTEGFTFTASNGHHIQANVSDNNSQGMVFSEGSNFIEQNTIINNVLIGVRLSGLPALSGNLLVNNFFIDNGAGIALTENDAGAANNVANFNSFTGNTLNIGSTHAANFNAQCNWFETTDAGAIAASITGNVTFTPFLIDGTDTDPVLDGFQPVAGTCIVTPVTLTKFTAAGKNYQVHLKWSTSQEMNSSHFLLEKSFNNSEFVAVGQVAAKGFSAGESNYGFVDATPGVSDRAIYYRLISIDRDGSRKVSPVVTVTIKSAGAFVQSVYPNPLRAGSVITAEYISDRNEQVSISLINSTGQTMVQSSRAVGVGLNKLKIAVPAGILPGIIFMRIHSASGVSHIPLSIK